MANDIEPGKTYKLLTYSDADADGYDRPLTPEEKEGIKAAWKRLQAEEERETERLAAIAKAEQKRKVKEELARREQERKDALLERYRYLTEDYDSPFSSYWDDLAPGASIPEVPSKVKALSFETKVVEREKYDFDWQQDRVVGNTIDDIDELYDLCDRIGLWQRVRIKVELLEPDV
jgi:hypothetical protein